MKYSTTLLLLLLIQLSSAQNCNINFVDRVFGVQVENDVMYGSAVAYNGQSTDLAMNIYKPHGDGQLERPVLLFIHGGGFFGGTRQELDSLSHDYARRGYVCATMSYRLGFYAPTLSFNPYTYDEAEVIRAAYRSMQDARGAVRFLKGRSVQDSSSTSNFFIGGFSAGAIASLHVTYADQPADRPAQTYAIANATIGFNTYPRGDMGPPEGTIAMNGENSDVKACVSFFGGLFDTLYIDSPQDPPLFMYHQTGDPVVGCPYKQGLWNVGFGTNQNYPYIYGSCVIDDRLANLGFSPANTEVYIHTGNDHGVHDFPLLDSLVAHFLAEKVCPAGVGIAEQAAEQITVSPNPTNDLITLSLPGPGAFRYVLYDQMGRRLMEGSGRNSVIIDLRDKASGVHVLQVMKYDAVHTVRVVKE